MPGSNHHDYISISLVVRHTHTHTLHVVIVLFLEHLNVSFKYRFRFRFYIQITKRIVLNGGLGCVKMVDDFHLANEVIPVCNRAPRIFPHRQVAEKSPTTNVP